MLIVVGVLLVGLTLATVAEDPSDLLSARRLLGAVVGPVAIVGGAVMTLWWWPPYRLIFSAEGIDLKQRGKRLVIPWEDIGSWWIGIPDHYLSRRGLGWAVLRVRPAAHVANPADVPWRLFWSKRRKQWSICTPDLIGATDHEIITAMNQYVPHLREPATSTRPNDD
jgi:hypothetical protein